MIITDIAWDSIIAVLLAVAGGLARQLNTKGRKPKTLRVIMQELYVSFFSGIMTLLLVLATGISGYWILLLCGIGGWTSPNILYFITRSAETLMGTEKDELNGKR